LVDQSVTAICGERPELGKHQAVFLLGGESGVLLPLSEEGFAGVLDGNLAGRDYTGIKR